tara:strand:+ start:691 stop:1974 length:1284 start_codon:yes stop_codon:yes gene_type:complete
MYFLTILIIISLAFTNEEFINDPYCGSDDVVHIKNIKFPWYKQAVDNLFDQALRYSEDGNVNRETVYQIPVVFHVVYNTDAQNLSNEVIQSQLDVLNEDFRRLNENASETREEFLEFAGDPHIEFYLATEDPNGNSTSGITHTYTSRSGFPYISFTDLFTGNISLDEVKSSETGGVDAWDTNRYMNVWVCNVEESFLGQVLGFAYPPFNVQDALDSLDYESVPDWSQFEGVLTDQSLQGIVLHYPVVGTNNPQADDDGLSGNELGRTLIHETGHYLGLRHIWGDALLGDGCGVDDGIIDTPNQSAASNFTCNLNINSCSDNPTDYYDMVENYMDYSNDACMNMFTNVQIDVMRAVLEIARPGLIEGQENNCTAGDLNGDTLINVLDIVLSVNIALNIDEYNSCGDMNYDNTIDILDIVLIVNAALGS